MFKDQRTAYEKKHELHGTLTTLRRGVNGLLKVAGAKARVVNEEEQDKVKEEETNPNDSKS